MGDFEVGISVAELELNSGKISFDPGDIVLVVGPNNVGKSAMLRDMYGHLLFGASFTASHVVQSLKITKRGDNEKFARWIVTRTKQDPTRPSMYDMGGVRAPLNNWINSWERLGTQGLQSLHIPFVANITTETRLSAANPTPIKKFTNEAPSHPLHFLYLFPETVEAKFRRIFRRAFGTDLVVNRLAGAEITLHVGQCPPLSSGEPVTSEAYIRAVEKLPRIETQGDGMRCFAGVTLWALVGDVDVLIADEPEAFLHPPQARLLGQLLVTETSPNTQIFLATHSGDFIRGILNTDSARVKVLRLTREGGTNPFHYLSQNSLRELWRDPILRYSNALDGLFHEQVVICEGDADCRFYGAVVDAIWANEPEFITPDALFIHCGGKHRMPVLVRALRALNVDVRVVSDFDLFESERPLRQIFEALGGNWKSVEDDWRAVRAAIGQRRSERPGTEVKSEIEVELAKVGATFERDIAERIRQLLPKASPWAIAKDVGKAYLPAGDVRETYDRLLQTLAGVNLFVVEDGELESFYRHASNHGPAWVNEVVEQDLANDPNLATARAFVKKVVSENN